MRPLVLLLALLIVRSTPAAQSPVLIPTEEANALLSLREKCVGKMLHDVTASWDPKKSCSDWQGVFCDSSQHIVELSLEGADGWETKACSTTTWKSLDLSALQYLTDITIHHLLEGPIPEKMSQLVALANLDLSRNNLDGKLSTTVPLLRNLRYLKLASNKLTGDIPTNMPELSTLDLHGNQLSGIVNSQLLATNGLNMLILFDVGHNKLKGDISAVAPLPGLRYFDMSSNLLTGKLPETLVASSSTSRLRVIHLEHNSFHGTIPSSFSKLPELQELTLQHNKLTGLIPEFVAANADTPTLRINLAANDFSCPRPKGDVYMSADDCTCRAGHFSKKNQADDCRMCPPQSFVAQDSRKSGGNNFATSCTLCQSPQIAPDAGSSSCFNPPTSTSTSRAMTTTTANKLEQLRGEFVTSLFALAIVALMLLVIVSACIGCCKRYIDDNYVTESRKKQMENELEAEVLSGNLTRSAADEMLREWTEAYNQQTKSARTCGWMCFLMNKKQTKRTMIQNHMKRQVQVAPQMRSPLKVPSCPAQYQNDEEVCFSATTTVDLRDQNYQEGPQQAYQQQEYQQQAYQEEEYQQQEYQEHEFPRKKMSKKEWQIKRKKSKVKSKFGDWEKLYDEEAQSDYYHNTVTGESQWEQPDEFPLKKLSKQEWQIKRKKSKIKFKFGDWEKLYDEEVQSDYYYNTVTGESQWEKPDEFIEDVELHMP